MFEFMELTTVVADLSSTINVSGDGESASGIIKIMLLLSGPAYFAFMYARYRNKGARHMHERETEAEVTNLTGDDQKVKRITGTSSAYMAGANQDKVRGARN